MLRAILFFILISQIFIPESQAATDKNINILKCRKKRCIHIQKPKGCPEGPEGATGPTGPIGSTGPIGPTGPAGPNLSFGFVYSTAVQEMFTSTIVNFENTGPFDAS